MKPNEKQKYSTRPADLTFPIPPGTKRRAGNKLDYDATDPEVD
jgi:hypothetical protein